MSVWETGKKVFLFCFLTFNPVWIKPSWAGSYRNGRLDTGGLISRDYENRVPVIQHVLNDNDAFLFQFFRKQWWRLYIRKKYTSFIQRRSTDVNNKSYNFNFCFKRGVGKKGMEKLVSTDSINNSSQTSVTCLIFM